MEIPLSPELQRVIQERIRSGKYGSPEEVVAAGLGALLQQEGVGDFTPGELDALLAAGENTLAQAGETDSRAVFDALRRSRPRP